MAITAGAACRFVELINLNERSFLVPCHYHLGYSLAGIYSEVVVRKVDQQHANLTPVIGIDGSG